MLTKKILFIWFLWVSLLVFWYHQNFGLPLGYDHGAYRHLINLLGINQDTGHLPTYLQYQFEPFSWTFFYSISTFIGQETLFWWGYLFIFILTWISLFLLWKKNRKYTLGSHLGLYLFLFSSVQYMNLWWAFGKQMFATFFLILLMRYYKKYFIAFLLIAGCISLHRLTGFVALSYFLVTFLNSQRKNRKIYLFMFFGICVGFLSYLPLFYEQVFPYIKNFILNPQKQVFIDGKYWTGFNWGDLLFYIFPVLLMTILWIVHFSSIKSVKYLWRSPIILYTFLLWIFITFRFVAHTRLWTFLDLFLIIILTRHFYHLFHRKWIYVFLIIQCALWLSFVNKWHTPFIEQNELNIIKKIIPNMPEDINLVTLSWAHMSWLMGYTNREIYWPSQWIGREIWSPLERKNMKIDPLVLCSNLSKIDGKVIIYIWAQENYPSLFNNNCIGEIRVWNNGTRLFTYLR